MAGLAMVAAVVWLARSRGVGWERFNLLLVMLSAIALIHVCGVVVLKFSLGYSWPQAIALGSTVFLPFDILKAALATALTVPFIPTRDAHPTNMETTHARV